MTTVDPSVFRGRASQALARASLTPRLWDIAEMPGFNPDGPQNGTQSVTEGLIEFGPEPNEPRSIPTVRCVRHGATNCVAVMDAGRLYRCLTCNEGAFRP